MDRPRRLLRRLGVSVALLAAGAGVVAAQTLEIWQIQGPGMASPWAGRRVTTVDNPVTAVAATGFFIQTPTARSDGDPNTSDGIFVYLGGPPAVRTGDLVDVTGTVVEFDGVTEIATNPVVTVTAHGAPLPPPVDLDARHPSPNRPQPETELERLEGMRVRIATGTVTGPTDRHGSFAVVARRTRAYREAGIAFPGLPGLPVWDGNPEILEVDPDALGLPDVVAAAGSPVTGLEGVLTFAFGRYRIWPQSLTVGAVPGPGPVRPRVAGELTVATQNLERFFDDADDPATDDTVLAPAELETRLAKASLWISDVLRGPDVRAVEEVENLAVLRRLADRVATDDPALKYTAYLVDGHDPSGIDVGFLVRPSLEVLRVEQLDAGATFTFGGSTFPTFDRPPLLIEVLPAGAEGPAPLTLVAVHLRSLNGIDDPAKGPFVRTKRWQEAVALARDIQALRAADPATKLVVLGDFNAFGFTDGYVDVMGQITGRPDPLGALLPPVPGIVAPPLSDAVSLLPPAARYTFVNRGIADDLDHVLMSPSLFPWVRGVAAGRGNADAPVSLADEPGTALRTADHDGLVLYLMTDADGDGVPDDREPSGPRPPRRAGGRSRAVGAADEKVAAASREDGSAAGKRVRMEGPVSSYIP